MFCKIRRHGIIQINTLEILKIQISIIFSALMISITFLIIWSVFSMVRRLGGLQAKTASTYCNDCNTSLIRKFKQN